MSLLPGGQCLLLCLGLRLRLTLGWLWPTLGLAGQERVLLGVTVIEVPLPLGAWGPDSCVCLGAWVPGWVLSSPTPALGPLTSPSQHLECRVPVPALAPAAP